LAERIGKRHPPHRRRHSKSRSEANIHIITKISPVDKKAFCKHLSAQLLKDSCRPPHRKIRRCAPLCALKHPIRRAKKKPLSSESGVLSKLLVAFAALVDNAARGLASGLAGGLALAATAGLYGLLNILGLNGLDSAHW
jgi:hypothetical protein